MKRMIRTIFRVLSSLRLAVALIVTLALTLATATFLESAFDTSVAQFWVYRSLAFHALLGLLGLNLFSVAIDRLPWKARHGPFLLAHLGILLVLTGSLITEQFGVDGSLTLEEGERASAIEVGAPVLTLQTKRNGQTETRDQEIAWLPPGRAFRPIPLPELGMEVDRYLTHAESTLNFEAATDAETSRVAPALQLRLSGGPMRVSQDFWLWGGDPAWSSVSMGLARFDWVSSGNRALFESLPPPDGLAELALLRADEGIEWRSVSLRGEKRRGRIALDNLVGAVIDPGWKGIELRILAWLPRARYVSEYRPARVQFGEKAPPSAIRIRKGADSFWLGYGEQARVGSMDTALTLTYAPRRMPLPFAIRLERFQIENYQGSMNPMSFSSRVQLEGNNVPRDAITISMNEPLEHEGFTFYQSSYIPDVPRPTVSILSVNRDPGRAMKYLGSILLVTGAILLFVMKTLKRRKRSPRDR